MSLTTPHDRTALKDDAMIKALTSCNERQAATIVNLQAKTDEQRDIADRAWAEIAKLSAENARLREALENIREEDRVIDTERGRMVPGRCARIARRALGESKGEGK